MVRHPKATPSIKAARIDLTGHRRVVAILSEARLRSNFKELLKKSGLKRLMPMVKADGYGHGAVWVAQTLVQTAKDRESIEGFGVATLEEALALRSAFCKSSCDRESPFVPQIVVFSGLTPLHEDGLRACIQNRITPVVNTLDDLKWISQQKQRCPIHIKFNTGMNRLGIPFEDASLVYDLLAKNRIKVIGIGSHLGASEIPQDPLSQRQLQRFKGICELFAHHGVRFHLGNSGAILRSKAWNLPGLTDFARPGIALYGGVRADRINPVLTLRAQVLAIQNVKRGEGIGYGFTALGPDRVAILGMGYADGLKRNLSEKAPLLGRVSMDLSCISILKDKRFSHLKAGDWVSLWGDDPKALAPLEKWAQKSETISYELLTSISTRVKRIYG